MSIDGQTLDNQFVLATHQLMFEGEPSSYCRVQLFSHDGRYRFQVNSCCFYSTSYFLFFFFIIAMIARVGFSLYSCLWFLLDNNQHNSNE